MPSPEPGRGERPWLYFYAPASALYRISISLAIVGWIGSWSMALGSRWRGPGWCSRCSSRLCFRSGASCCAWPCPISCDDVCCMCWWRTLCIGLLVLLAGVPFPFATLAQGVVWIPEQAQVRTGADGFIVSLEARHGDRVEVGQALARLEDNRLVADAARLSSRAPCSGCRSLSGHCARPGQGSRCGGGHQPGQGSTGPG